MVWNPHWFFEAAESRRETPSTESITIVVWFAESVLLSKNTFKTIGCFPSSNITLSFWLLPASFPSTVQLKTGLLIFWVEAVSSSSVSFQSTRSHPMETEGTGFFSGGFIKDDKIPAPMAAARINTASASAKYNFFLLIRVMIFLKSLIFSFNIGSVSDYH